MGKNCFVIVIKILSKARFPSEENERFVKKNPGDFNISDFNLSFPRLRYMIIIYFISEFEYDGENVSKTKK